MVKGLVLFNGASSYDAAPIVAILCKSKNRKVGTSTQLWIMREDVAPIEASRIGADFAVCGNCKHRGTVNPEKQTGWAVGRTCYVDLGHGPTQIYKAYKRGAYTPATTLEQIRDFIGDDFLRIGAYGDPGALPPALCELLGSLARSGFTSYTHAHTVDSVYGDNAARFSMVSADTIGEAQAMHARGFRTFRVIPVFEASKPLLKNEIICPSDRGVQCKECRLCNGAKSNAKSIAIIAHGANKNAVK